MADDAAIHAVSVVVPVDARERALGLRVLRDGVLERRQALAQLLLIDGVMPSLWSSADSCLPAL